MPSWVGGATCPSISVPTCVPVPAPSPKNPSPTAALGSNCSPASVSAEPPICSAAPWNPSVTPSDTPPLTICFPACLRAPLPMLLSTPTFLIPIALSTPLAALVPSAPFQSSQFGSSRSLFLALSRATGPAICTASNKVGPNKAPTAMPTGPPTAVPTAAPPPLANKDPAICPACSNTALGKYSHLNPLF